MILLRSVLFNAWLYGVTAVFAVVTLAPGAGKPDRAADRALAVAQFWARTVLAGLRWLCGITWVVTGREHLPTAGAALIASNHQSAFDTLVWLLLVPRGCYVVKRELMRVPVFGPACRLTGMMIVDRNAGGAAIRGLLREADRAVAERRQIVIFPEGTRVAPGVRAPLQSGVAALASRTGLPVIPVATDSGYCWGRRAFRKRPGVIHIAIGAPIPPGLKREELMRRLEQAFAEGQAAIARAG
jgi:1-acyl-sn-glycerol-3-phosphate acyltransferase